ncbi:MAG: DNA primase [Eubacteriales bacterium]
MYYSDELIEEIRQRNDIVDVISEYVRLQKKGNSHFGLCPFHNEKSPSFSVTSNKQMYYCFGCGVGGNVFTFLMEYEKYTFQEAITHLAARAGVELPQVETSEYEKKKSSRKAQLLEVNKEAAKYYYYQLRDASGTLGYDYLKSRMLSKETITHFGLGYANQSSHSLYEYLKSKGYDLSLIKEAGLVHVDERQGAYDKFFNRVMFPIQDMNHRVIGFGGRVMGDGKPKYLNSPETPIFDKSRNLYGLNFARTTRKSYMIICEGYMDVIALHQAGFTEAVASLGTAFTTGQASLLRRYTKEVRLIYDSDQAGIKATLRAIPILKESGIDARVVSLEPYKDPDEYIQAMGAEAFATCLGQAKNSFLFQAAVIATEYDFRDPAQKTNFFKRIAELICQQFPEEIERDNYIQAIAHEYIISQEQLKKLVAGCAMTESYKRQTPVISSRKVRETKEDASNKVQRLLLTWISDTPSVYEQISSYITADDFINPLYQRVARCIIDGINQDNLNPAAIISLFPEEEEQRQVASLFHTKIHELETKDERQKALHDIICKVKQQSYEEQLSQMDSDSNAFIQVIQGKKLIEELKTLRIHLPD